MTADRDDTPVRNPILKVDSRITLALERTLLAWTRTALALVGFGFIVARLPLLTSGLASPTSPAPPGVSRWLGVAMVAMGVTVQILALATHAHAVRRIRQGDEVSLHIASAAYVVGLVLVGAGVIVGVYLVATL